MASDVFGIVGSTVAAAFRVEAVVAEGGFAVVYRAHHEGFRAPVALKCLKIPGHMSAEEQARFEQQFGAEAELLFKLSAAIPTVVRPLHVVITLMDGAYASAQGRVFALGPLRAGWIAGALVLTGIAVALVRFFKSEP
jgi:hypothetical protein